MAEDVEHQFWYNMHTGEVEQGFVSPSVDGSARSRPAPRPSERSRSCARTARSEAEEEAAED